jgi:hypothetical protein
MGSMGNTFTWVMIIVKKCELIPFGYILGDRKGTSFVGII